MFRFIKSYEIRDEEHEKLYLNYQVCFSTENEDDANNISPIAIILWEFLEKNSSSSAKNKIQIIPDFEEESVMFSKEKNLIAIAQISNTKFINEKNNFSQSESFCLEIIEFLETATSNKPIIVFIKKSVDEHKIAADHSGKENKGMVSFFRAFYDEETKQEADYIASISRVFYDEEKRAKINENCKNLIQEVLGIKMMKKSLENK